MTPVPSEEETSPPPTAPAPPAIGPRPTTLPSLGWSTPEIAWPLSIAAGFAGSYLGVKSGFPGAPALIAAAAFSPIYVRLQARRRCGLAFLSSVAWVVGIIAALVGTAVEGDLFSVLDSVPFASAFADAEWRLVEGDSAVFLRVVSRNLAVFALVVLLARPYAGVLGLLVVAFIADMLGAGTGSFAVRMLDESWSPSHSAIVGTPPHLALALLGSLAVASVVASPGRLLPFSSLHGERRTLLGWGAAVGVGALLLEPVFDPLWLHWRG